MSHSLLYSASTVVGAISLLSLPQFSYGTPALLQGDPNIYVELSRQVTPSVVNISTLSSVKRGSPHGVPEDLFRGFFGMPGGPGLPGQPGGGHGQFAPRTGALGTGFLIDSSGVIVTNNHVVAGADEIRVTFTEAMDEKPTEGRVIGRDPELDVALIRVTPPRALKALSLGDSDTLQVGEYVAAIGNPFGQGHSLTHGIISAKGRRISDLPFATYLQTDAPINPGNSGGPLVNLKGEVIGINNAIDARAQGIGFAIPINAVKGILPQLRSNGVVARGYLGLSVGELTPDLAEHLGLSRDARAPVISEVMARSPAEKAHLKPYDVILKVNGKEVKSGADLVAEVGSAKAGATVPLVYSRNGKEASVQITLGKRPQPRQGEDQEG